MDKDKNKDFFSSRPNTRETLRQYDAHKRRKKKRHKPRPFDDDSDRGAAVRPSKKGFGRDPTKPVMRDRKRGRGRPGFGRLGLPAIAIGASRLTAAAVIILILGAGAFGLWLFTADNALEVFVDGEPLGFIAERDTTAEDLTAQVETAIGVTIGTNVVLDQVITIEPARAPTSDVISRPEIIPLIRDSVTFSAEGFAIYVDGVALGALRSRDAAESVLNSLVRRDVPEGAELVGEPSFAEDVTIQSRFMSEDDFESPEVMLVRLSQEQPVSQTYTVQSGDSMYTIASRFGMTLEAIFAANPGINPVNPALRVGQSVNVVRMTPILSVRTVEVSVTNEEEPYGTETITNPTRQNTFRSVLQPGHTGVREVTRHITRVNGVITDTEIISEHVIQEPVNEIVEVGTRN